MAGVLLLWGSASGTPALAQSWPARPVRVIVPFPAGSGADLVTRLVAPRMAEGLGQNLVVENRAGAAGTIGAEAAARAAPDGYTLLTSPASLAISATLYPKLGYDLVRDFVPAALLASVPFLLVVHPSLPVRSPGDLVALAKREPGRLTYASTGTGSSPHLATELFALQAGIRMLHVPYKGSPPALTDLVGGQVTLMFANALSVLPFVKGNRLRALATSGAKRTGAAPGVPTFAESGLPGFEATTWFGLLAPAGVPGEIVTRVHAEAVRAVRSPDIREKLAAQGADPMDATPAQAARFIENEIAKWGRVVRASGAKAE